MSMTSTNYHLRLAVRLQQLSPVDLAEVIWTAEAIQPSIGSWLERSAENISRRSVS